ncbi:integrator complex subunit 13-like isoform X1 [Argiope bruennichi]|uniref:Protein asunder n=1 Tax=Argiope bruennichi TaxID=94029 RepID=A0A8T0E7D6_ARGBR|nr:integrator complex subunit 13-like isoform X1 [Argiope bruennichi]XP_055937581.1 integrator complex subunit 13-like isoform X1 [Argiope bruennichi]KAF8766812.1 Integrator complex subunit 13 like protein [Argiope bruennichi]
MTFPVSHKTIFVLDHGPNFLGSCYQNMEFDIFTKTRQPGIIPLAPLSKSLWTCSVEAAIEYCRIVWDIFPTEKLIRFIVSDSESLTLNTWAQDQQNLSHLMGALAQVGPPENAGNKDCNVMHGLNAAIEALCECSEIQHEKRTSMTESAGKVVNRGRVICFTNVKSDLEVNSLVECFQSALVEHNKLASSSDSLMAVQHCELILMHVYPVNKESCIASQNKKVISPILSIEIHNVKSGRNLAAKLGILVQQHYNLASTTVTGIPMKEEQNASSSANYDVELLHPVAAHAEVFKTGVVNAEGVHITTVKEGQLYETVTLKWCTPRSSSVELQYCTSSFRITPVDVNNRPSSCLTNFLLNGRAVMLEMPRKSGSKVLSHMLASHGGEIFIHTLGTGRSILEDPPSISEGCGGRVTDYRINDFGDFMKQNRLVPHYPKKERIEIPIEAAKKKLTRLTQYWPLVFSHTTIFNNASQIGPLLQLITKETLDTNDVTECKKSIYNLVSSENKGLPLNVPTTSTRGKGPKREEHYRLAWNELEAFVRCHCTTAEHQSVLECLLECRKPNTDGEGSTSIASVKVQLGAQSPSHSPSKRNGKDDKEFSKSFDSDDGKDSDRKRSFDDSGDSFNKFRPAKKLKLSADAIKSSGNKSLLSLWTDRITSEHEKRFVEFTGRVNGNGPAKLYPNLKSEANGDG